MATASSIALNWRSCSRTSLARRSSWPGWRSARLWPHGARTAGCAARGEAGGCCDRGTTLLYDPAAHCFKCGRQGDWGSCLFTCAVDEATVVPLEIPEELLEHEYLGSFQCEMRELEELEASVLGYQPTHQIIDDAANPAAELQLLNTTLAVLGSEPLA